MRSRIARAVNRYPSAVIALAALFLAFAVPMAAAALMAVH